MFEGKKTLYQLRKEQGVCAKCGGPRDREDYVICLQCREKERMYERQKRDAYRAMRRCSYCGKKLDKTEKFAACVDCRKARADYYHEYYINHRGKRRFSPGLKDEEV